MVQEKIHAIKKTTLCVCSIFQFNRKKRHNSSVLLYLPSTGQYCMQINILMQCMLACMLF